MPSVRTGLARLRRQWSHAHRLGLYRVLGVLGLKRAGLAGLSMGGGIALGFSLQAPERVEKLALIDSACLDDAIPSGRSTWFFVHTPGLSAIGWHLLRSSRHVMRSALLRHMRHRPEMVTPQLVDDLMRLARKHRAGGAVLKWQRREITWKGLRTNYLNRLPQIRIPTLILHSDVDRLLPLQSRSGRIA